MTDHTGSATGDWLQVEPRPEALPRPPESHDPDGDSIYGLFFRPGLRTYAVMDGSRIPNLAEMLDQAGNRHQSLFSGEFAKQVGNHGPVLTELARLGPFTRNLLTDDANPAPWHLWGYEPGIFVRSEADFDTIRRHLSKFTRAPDRSGKDFFVRFWDPDFLPCYLALPGATESPLIRSLFRPGPIEALIGFNVFDGVVEITPDAEAYNGSIPARPAIDRDDLDRMGPELANRRSARQFARDYPAILNDVSMPDIRDRIARARYVAKTMGVTDKLLLGTFILLDVVYAPGFWSSDDFGQYWSHSPLPPDRRLRAYLDTLKFEARKSVPEFRAWW